MLRAPSPLGGLLSSARLGLLASDPPCQESCFSELLNNPRGSPARASRARRSHCAVYGDAAGSAQEERYERGRSRTGTTTRRLIAEPSVRAKDASRSRCSAVILPVAERDGRWVADHSVACPVLVPLLSLGRRVLATEGAGDRAGGAPRRTMAIGIRFHDGHQFL